MELKNYYYCIHQKRLLNALIYDDTRIFVPFYPNSSKMHKLNLFIPNENDSDS